MKTEAEKIAHYYAKQREYQQNAIARQRQKQANPEWRQQQYEKRRQRAQQAFEKAKSKTSCRGLKGRTPRASERRMMDKIGALPCIACYVHGVINYAVSLHHIEGRTADGAHGRVLPLCDGHHQHTPPAAILARFPWIVPVHADGKHGGKTEFEKLNGTQEHLYSLCLIMVENKSGYIWTEECSNG